VNQFSEVDVPTVLESYAGPLETGSFRLGGMEVAHAGFSLRGSKRETNDDRIQVAGSFGLVAVADGIGGSMFGGQAAQDCLELMQEYLASVGPITDRVATLRAAIAWTNGRMLAKAWRVGGSEQHPGGCCFAGVLLDEVRSEFTTFHVGDCAVHVQAGRNWEKLTVDHLEAAARPSARPGRSRKPRIRRAMGMTPVPDVEFHTSPLTDGARLLITSDGCDLVTLARSGVPAPQPEPGESLEGCIRGLAAAVVAGPLRDDTSAIMLDVSL
jgi:serine/threonine protein phosphatase PrpC